MTALQGADAREANGSSFRQNQENRSHKLVFFWRCSWVCAYVLWLEKTVSVDVAEEILLLS